MGFHQRSYSQLRSSSRPSLCTRWEFEETSRRCHVVTRDTCPPVPPTRRPATHHNGEAPARHLFAARSPLASGRGAGCCLQKWLRCWPLPSCSRLWWNGKPSPRQSVCARAGSRLFPTAQRLAADASAGRTLLWTIDFGLCGRRRSDSGTFPSL